MASLGMNIYNWDRSRIAQPDWSSAATFKDRSSTTIKQRAISLGTRLNLTDDFHFFARRTLFEGNLQQVLL